MFKKTIIILTLFLTTNIVAQNNSMKINDLEFGLGYIFKTKNEASMVRYQIASRNILLNERLGFSYTIEDFLNAGKNKSTNTKMYDLFGINYKFNNDFSFEVGIGLATNVFSEIDDRKAISITYHPDNTPFTITTGYSLYFGHSLNVNYRIIFDKKKEKLLEKKSG